MPADHPEHSRLQRYRKPLLLAGPLLLLLFLGVFYELNRHRVSTDDAYVVAARTDISTNVAGRVTQILVKDNQPVRRGDALFKLDDRDFILAEAEARATLATVTLHIQGLRAAYRQRQAEVAAAQDTLNFQTKELERQQHLQARGISSQEQLDQTQHAWTQAQLNLQWLQQEEQNALAALDFHPEQAVEAQPAVLQAKAALDRAVLNRSYTVVTAPEDGIVSKVDQLQVGDYINAATPLFALVSTRKVWIEANFKETDLTRMRPGQSGTVEIDAYPGTVFKARVQSLSPGTGSSYSLLPPENATGNWVKVVQRLPVRLTLDEPDARLPLRAGLSANVVVNIAP